MITTIYIKKRNEYFWDNLTSKGAWVNLMIDNYKAEAKRQEKLKEQYDKKTMVQDTPTKTQG